MSTSTVNFKRGTLLAYNLLKDGKKHTVASIRAAFKKAKLSKHAKVTCYRLGRLGREAGEFDIIAVINKENKEQGTFQLVRGVSAKKSIAEKSERFGTLVSTRKRNARSKSAKKVSRATVSKKSVAKKPARKPVTVGASSSSELSSSLLDE